MSFGKCLILIPVGPGTPDRFFQDTLESVATYMPPDQSVLCLIDNTGDNRYDGFTCGDIDRIHIRRSDIYAYRDVPQSVFGPLWLEQMRVFAEVRRMVDFSLVLRLDTDALVTGPSPHCDILQAAEAMPGVGILGAFTVRGNGAPKIDDMREVGRSLQREMSLRKSRRRALRSFGSLRSSFALKKLYRHARRNGYELGLTVTGGAAFMTRSLIDRWIEMGLHELNALRFSRLTDDVLFGLCTYAAGHRLYDAPVGVMAVNWQGLSYPPEELTRRQIKVIHSTKAETVEEEAAIRQHFATARRNWIRATAETAAVS
jgi:hypothetical protein